MTRSTDGTSSSKLTLGSERNAPALEPCSLSSRAQLERTIHGPAPNALTMPPRQAFLSVCQSPTVNTSSGAICADLSTPCKVASVPALVEKASDTGISLDAARTTRASSRLP